MFIPWDLEFLFISHWEVISAGKHSRKSGIQSYSTNYVLNSYYVQGMKNSNKLYSVLLL